MTPGPGIESGPHWEGEHSHHRTTLARQNWKWNLFRQSTIGCSSYMRILSFSRKRSSPTCDWMSPARSELIRSWSCKFANKHHLPWRASDHHAFDIESKDHSRSVTCRANFPKAYVTHVTLVSNLRHRVLISHKITLFFWLRNLFAHSICVQSYNLTLYNLNDFKICHLRIFSLDLYRIKEKPTQSKW